MTPADALRKATEDNITQIRDAVYRFPRKGLPHMCAVGAIVHYGATGPSHALPIKDIVRWNDEEGLSFLEIADRLDNLESNLS